MQILEDGLLDQFRMQRWHTIDIVRHDKGQLAHIHVAIVDDANVGSSLFQMIFLNQLDNSIVPRQDAREEMLRPTF